MADIEIVPYYGTRTPADFDTLFDELEAARGTSASLSDAIGEKADAASTLAGYGITDAYTKTEINTALSEKQPRLTAAQQAAVDSGITAAKLTDDEAALAEVVDSGAKNVLIFDGVGTGTSNVGTSYTSNGITFELQSDGTIHVTGTISSGNSYCYFYIGTSRTNIVDFFDGNYVLSGNPQGASTSTYRLWYKVGTQTAVSVGSSSVVLPAVTGETNAVLGMQVDDPQTNLDIIFKPMICTKAEWDVSDAYVPYVPTNKELYEMILALQNGTRSAPALALAKAEPEETEPETGEEEMR